MSNTAADPIDLGFMINEKVSLTLTRQLLDGNGDGIPAADLASLTLTLYEFVTGAIVNGRDHVSVLNATIGTVDANGVLTLDFTQADGQRKTTAITEMHVALLEWETSAGKSGKGELLWRVRRVRRVT